MARARARRAERKAGPTLSRSTMVALIAIAGAAIVAFSPAIDAPFQFDDVAAIAANPTIDRLWPPGPALAPPSRTAVAGRPVVNYSLAVNHAIAARGDGGNEGGDTGGTTGYHIANILIHVLSGLLLFGIVRRTWPLAQTTGDLSGRGDGVALIVAALWLLHPIQTEAVDYVIQRTELLVSACWLATLYASIRAWDARTRARRLGWYIASVVACLLGMGSKEVMAGAPIMILLYDRTFRGASWRSLFTGPSSRTWFYAGLAATWILLAVLVAGGGRADSVGFGLGVAWYRYLYSQAWAVSHYARLLLWPAGLTYDYGWQPVSGWAGVPGAVLLTGAAAITILAWTRAQWRWLGFLGAWFFLLLAPSSSVVPISTEIAAERRVYLASAAILFLAVIAVDAVWRRVAARYASRASALVFAAVATACGIVTYRRSELYRSPEALWRDASIKVPSNARAYDNLAALALHRADQGPEEAERLLRRAIAADSMYLLAWTNLAAVELEQGRSAEARALLERALAIDPGFADANERLGAILVGAGEYARGITLLERVTAAYPTDGALVSLASADMALGRTDAAVLALRRALEVNPRRVDAAVYLGALLVQLDRPDQSIPYLETAARVGKPTPVTLALLSLAYARVGRTAESIQVAEAASREPVNDEGVYVTLGRAMLLAERTKEATVYFAEAVRLAPADPEAITRLGVAVAATGDAAGAERLFRRALAAEPNYPPARQALESLRSSQRP